MATAKEQQELIEILKFTPRTYKIQMWGYGGEVVMGTVDRKIYDYFKHRRLDLSEFAWGSDYADDNNIPEEMWPFPPGSWYECDDMGHTNGVSRNAGTVQIEDEQGNTVYEKSFDDISGGGCDGEPDWSCGDEIWIGSQPDGTVVFIGRSNEKGTFFEGEIELRAPFDITKLCLEYDEIDGEELVTSVYYDGEQIENWGGSTDGKSSDFGMYIAGSRDVTGNWDKYTNLDDIKYTVTDWFPAKTKPVRLGRYNIKTKDGHSYQATWNGTFWHNDWNEEKIKVTEWQGIDHDPEYGAEWDPVIELEKIVSELDIDKSNDNVSDVDLPTGSWPFSPSK